MVKDIVPGNVASSPRGLVNFNGTLFFVTLKYDAPSNSYTGYTLYKSDGTNAGTVSVFDFPVFSLPDNFTITSNILYFRYNGTLWRTDGTTANTVAVLPGNTDLNPQQIVSVGNTIYFNGYSATNGLELWRSDGSIFGTYLLKDILVGTNNSNPLYITNMNGALYFSANDGVNGNELWKSDGTTNGTVLLSDLNPGSSSSNPGVYANYANGNNVLYNGGAFPRLFHRNNKLYFTALTAANGVELFTSDGTTSGTTLVKDIVETSTTFANFIFADNNVLVYTRNNQIWRTNGTANGTYAIANEANFSDAYANLNNFSVIGNKVLVVAPKPIYGQELWVADLNVVLPLTLLNFTATQQTNSIVTNWQTTNEVNVSHFTVQRSTNGSNFTDLGNVTATGGGNYSYNDDLSTINTQPPTIYYRLKMVDKDGSFTYSKVVSVSLTTHYSSFNIYPNPVKETLFAQVTSTKAYKATVQITNMQGRILQQQQVQLQVGNTSISLNTTGLLKGSYVLVVNGEVLQQKQFVKE